MIVKMSVNMKIAKSILNDKTVVIVEHGGRGDLKMTYAEYRSNRGPGVCENAPLIKLEHRQVCLVCGKLMWFHGNPYEERFGQLICWHCLQKKRVDMLTKLET